MLIKTKNILRTYKKNTEMQGKLVKYKNMVLRKVASTQLNQNNRITLFGHGWNYQY